MSQTQMSKAKETKEKKTKKEGATFLLYGYKYRVKANRRNRCHVTAG